MQFFKALGIYNNVERDVLRGFENARLKYWGIPMASEDRRYYNKSERPQVEVIYDVILDESDVGKTILIQNDGQETMNYRKKNSTSTTQF
ncbi:hypothetical protein [Chryseobacterium sp. JK1]|uniref:hypothetical protein n=1 Tax=Chryseobacterium sp. JK1 TaxID=874294 RepID=UPI003D69E726